MLLLSTFPCIHPFSSKRLSRGTWHSLSSSHHQSGQMDSRSQAHCGFIILLTGNFLPSEYIRGFHKPPLSGWNEAASLLAARNEPGSGSGLWLCVSSSSVLPKAWWDSLLSLIMSYVLTCLLWPSGMLFITVFFHQPVVVPSPRHFAHH